MAHSKMTNPHQQDIPSTILLFLRSGENLLQHIFQTCITKASATYHYEKHSISCLKQKSNYSTASDLSNVKNREKNDNREQKYSTLIFFVHLIVDHAMNLGN